MMCFRWRGLEQARLRRSSRSVFKMRVISFGISGRPDIFCGRSNAPGVVEGNLPISKSLERPTCIAHHNDSEYLSEAKKMSDQEQKPLPVVSEWALEEVKAHCEAIQRDGKATTIRRVKFYAFLENQTWGPGSIEAALYALYPNQFSPSSGRSED